VLAELTIRDFAIVEQLRITWDPGLNVLTGETGAGKSIVVDAVGALLGDRLGPEMIRAGQERASIEGIFVVEPASAVGTAIHELLAGQELLEEDGQLILSRELARGGRSVARLNGRAVPLSLLQQVGERLVDVHGQSQHLSLLRIREHLDFLDRFAGLMELRQAVAELVARWQAVQAERRKLQEEIRTASRERDLLRHQVAEIEAANLQAGEEDELANLRERLRHGAKLREAAEQSFVALQGLDEQRGAADLLAQAAGLCTEASRADSRLAEVAELLQRVAADAEDVGRELRRYIEAIESDPRQIEDIEARYLAMADLKRKYGETVQGVLAYLEQARVRLATAERGEELLAELAQRELTLQEELARAALELSTRRTQATRSLREAVERELKHLNLPAAQFEIAVEQQTDSDGIDWPGFEQSVRTAESQSRVAVGASGADRVEFLFSANPGEPPRGLGRIASGGELARVSLALKAVLARVDQRATLIFDEIDVGVGGRGAPVVGKKLWELTRTHQVLCVTHLPQVAAFASQHLVVTKRLEGGSTRAVVEHVLGAERITELSAMLGGGPRSQAAEANARELLARSEEWKSGRAATDSSIDSPRAGLESGHSLDSVPSTSSRRTG
jgi:DNA repair protein RecN (Recombination protein N)